MAFHLSCLYRNPFLLQVKTILDGIYQGAVQILANEKLASDSVPSVPDTAAAASSNASGRDSSALPSLPEAAEVKEAAAAAAESTDDAPDFAPEVNAIMDEYEVSAPANARLRLCIPMDRAAPTDANPTPALPSAEHWCEALAVTDADPQSWLRGLLCAPHLIRGKLFVANNLSRMFYPRAGISVELSATDNSSAPDRIALFDATLGMDEPTVEAVYTASTHSVAVTIRHPTHAAIQALATGTADSDSARTQRTAQLSLRYVLQASKRTGEAPLLIEEDWGGRCTNICNFYRQLWSDEASDQKSDAKSALPPVSAISAEAVRSFRAAVGELESDADPDRSVVFFAFGLLHFVLKRSWSFVALVCRLTCRL